jgi:cytochrome P450
VAFPPGPRGRRWSGSLPEYRRDPFAFLRQGSREFGDVFSYRLGHQRVCFVNHPSLIERVLVTDSRILPKGLTGDPHGVLQILLGEGMLTADGPEWLRRRRLARPVFAPERFAGYAARVTACGERTLSDWEDGQTRDLHHEMTRVAVRIIGELFLDTDVDAVMEEVGQSIAIAMREHMDRIRRPVWLPGRVLTPGKIRFRRAIERLDEIIRWLIRTRRQKGGGGEDLLSRWLEFRDADGRPASEDEIRDEVATFFLAGHDTTALALGWAWHLLSRNPESEGKLHAELDSVLGGRDPGFADLRQLPWTDAVLRETLRLYPSAWGFARICLEDYELGGYTIAAGTSLLVSPWITQRDPRFFDDPDAFRPERWSDGLESRLPAFAYFPFGGGPRGCIGSAFGMMEAALLLAVIARRFRFDPVPGHPVVPWPAITLRPRYGLRMVLRRR